MGLPSEQAGADERQRLLKWGVFFAFVGGGVLRNKGEIALLPGGE